MTTNIVVYLHQIIDQNQDVCSKTILTQFFDF